MYNISKHREFFWDETFTDPLKTTAEFLLHHPVRKGIVLEHDAPWEGDGCDYHNFFRDGDIYRMYYLGWHFGNTHNLVVCYAESKDGINWIKPTLRICEYNGSYDNNIILDRTMVFDSDIDNFMVFKDTNPDCPPEQKYKAIMTISKGVPFGLHSMYSKDGIHFSYGELLSNDGHFDSLNVAFRDENAACYRCYFRGFHDRGNDGNASWSEDSLRDIRYMESADFKTWSKPKLVDFGQSEDVSLYTNVIQPYLREKNVLIGFPSRYLYRRKWNKNYDELCGQEKRLKRMETAPRYGLVVTDCVFITSRDGYHFKKYDEAFIRPGMENGDNWVYGDCYPARGFAETPSDIAGADPELSLYIPVGHWSGKATRLIRYTIRCDGFVSMHAGAVEKMLVTKPFCYEGSNLYINFETSALGYLYFTLVDKDGNRYESCETFGNTIDRRVGFDDGVVEKLSGKSVVLEVRMRDADLYSLIFQ